MSKKECVVCKKSLLAMDAQISEGGNSYHKGACYRLSRRAPRRARQHSRARFARAPPHVPPPPPPLRPAGCFKCSVCNGQLTILNLSTINGTL